MAAVMILAELGIQRGVQCYLLIRSQNGSIPIQGSRFHDEIKAEIGHIFPAKRAVSRMALKRDNNAIILTFNFDTRYTVRKRFGISGNNNACGIYYLEQDSIPAEDLVPINAEGTVRQGKPIR